MGFNPLSKATAAYYDNRLQIKHNISFWFFSEILGREDTWDILLSVAALFSFVQIVMLPFFPETPRYLLIEKGDDKACKKG